MAADPGEILTREGVLLTPRGLAAPARMRGVEGPVYRTVTPARELLDHLTRDVGVVSTASSSRRALLSLAIGELIEHVKRVEGRSVSRGKTAAKRRSSRVEFAGNIEARRLHAAIRGHSSFEMSEFLAGIDAPRGYLVERGRVRLVAARASMKSWELVLDRRPLNFRRLPRSLTAHQRRLKKSWHLLSSRHQRIEELASGLRADCDLSSRVLYAGREFSVVLEADDVVTLRRKLHSWIVEHDGTRRRFHPVEIRVAIGLDSAARPWVSGVTTLPNVNHMFVRDASVCVAGYGGSARDVATRALELLERAECVLKIPSNADGSGGYQGLASSGRPA